MVMAIMVVTLVLIVMVVRILFVVVIVRKRSGGSHKIGSRRAQGLLFKKDNEDPEEAEQAAHHAALVAFQPSEL